MKSEGLLLLVFVALVAVTAVGVVALILGPELHAAFGAIQP